MFESWKSLLRSEDPLDHLDILLGNCICIPNRAVQEPILRAYLLSPSSITTLQPLLIAYGRSGSGKSTLLKIMSVFYGHGMMGLLSADMSTSSSLRNEVRNRRNRSENDPEDFSDEDLEGKRNNSCILIDEINPDVIERNGALLSLLKGAFSRPTAYGQIASTGGKNQVFNFYAKWATSTIHPLWQVASLIELKRRSLIFKFKRWEDYQASEKLGNSEPTELEDIEDYDWEGYPSALEILWSEEKKLEYYAIRKRSKLLLRWSKIENNRQKLYLELIAVGLVFGVFTDELDAREKVEAFESFQTEIIEGSSNALQMLLGDWVTSQWEKEAQKLEVPEIMIPDLNAKIDEWVGKRELLEKPRGKTINEVMTLLGFIQVKSILIPGQVCYVKVR